MNLSDLQRSNHTHGVVAMLALAGVFAVPGAAAQQADVAFGPCGARVLSVVQPGRYADDDRRARALAGDRAWRLARKGTDAARDAMRADTNMARVRFAAIAPELLLTSQSDFPVPDNDGPMWAGRGTTTSVTAGIATCARGGRWGAIIAPTWWRSENRDFAVVTDPRIVPPLKPDAHPLSSPYHYEPRSLDVPRRFGTDPVTRLDPGVLAAWYATSRAEVGVTTEPEWWGPGMRNALLMSAQSAGVPRLYLKTVEPLRFFGELDAQVFLGRLSWSPFHRTTAPVDSARSLSGAMLVWRPSVEPRLQIGVARIVAAPMEHGGLFKQAFDFARNVGRPNAFSFGDSTRLRQPDQLVSVFGHWRLPDDNTELWLEWGRGEQPASLTDLLVSPSHSRAMTIGVQHLRPFLQGRWHARVAFEWTATNQTGSFRERPTTSWYTSRSVLGGFTQRGQVLGATIGPGSVGQWAAIDIASPRRSVGAFVQRVKWDDDSFYTIPRPIGNGLCKHDVSLSYGLRGLARSSLLGLIEASIASQRRINLYWQAQGFCFANEELQVDGRNLTMSFRWVPGARR